MPLDPVAEGDPHVPAHNEERDAINDMEVELGTKIPKPNSPSLGSLLRWDGDKYVPTNYRLFEGNGTPEGNTSAPVGSHYIDLLATGGTPEWYKATGTGNTGWVPLLSSLPWTNLTLGTGWAHVSGVPGQVSMLNGVVYLRGAMQRTTGTGIWLGSIPAAYCPAGTMLGFVRADGLSDDTGISLASNGVINVSSNVANSKPVHLESATIFPFRKN